MFLSREDEVTTLRGLVAPARPLTDPVARLIQVEGAVGIGKSALLAAALHDVPAIRIAGDAAGRSTPFSAMRDAVSALQGVPTASVVQRRLAANDGDITIVVDDAQWLDAATMGFLQQVLREVTSAPRTIVLAYRTGAAPRALVRSAQRTGAEVVRLEVPPLADDAVRMLARELASECAARVITEARGNPLLARVLVAAALRSPGAVRAHGALATLDAEDAEPLVAAVADDIDALTPAARDLVHAAALSDPDADLRALATRLGVAGTAAAEVRGAGLASAHGLDPVARLAARSRIDAGSQTRVLRAFAADARRAVVDRMDMLAQLGEHLDADDVAVLSGAASDFLASDPARVSGWLAAVPTPLRSARLDLLHARADLLRGWAREARWRAGSLRDTEVAAEAATVEAHALQLRGSAAEARAVLAAAAAASDPEAVMDWVACCVALDVPVPEEQFALLAAQSDDRLVIAGRVFRAMELLGQGRVAEARAHSEGVAAWCAAASVRVLERSLAVVGCAAWVACLTDEYAQAVRICERGMPVADASGQREAQATLLSAAAYALLQLGRVDEADELASRVVHEPMGSALPGVVALVQVIRVALAVARGDEDALHRRVEALADAAVPERAMWRRAVLSARARYGALLGNPAPYGLLAEPADAMSAMRWADAALVARVRGEKALERTLLEDGIAVAQQQGARGQYALLRGALADVLADAGELADARQLYAAVAEELAALGMSLHLGSVRARWAAMSRSARQVRVNLTPREAQIARLVMDGRTNQEIATALVVSRRTVEEHVSHLLKKLSVSNRAGIARALRRFG